MTAQRNGTVAGNMSHDHAVKVWNRSREVVAQNAGTMGDKVDRLADLAMVAELAEHLARCARCWQTGPYATDTPAEWLRWAVCQRPGMRDVLAPLARVGSGKTLVEGFPRATR